MSYLPLDQMAYKDSPNLDAAGRLRMSQATPLFGATQEYNYGPLLWDHYTATGGTATYTQATNSTTLRTNATTSGARALRQTKVYHRYVPGKSHFIKVTGRLQAGSIPTGSAVSNIGYFDDNNGLFFQQSSAGVAVVKRSDTTGSVVDTAVLQSSWNIDKMDGTGVSGITLDVTKEQIFLIDFQWLGVGRVRFGFAQAGKIYYVHEIINANVISSVYMRTANLPVRYEVFNTGGVGSDISLEAICAAVDSEGAPIEPTFYPTGYSAYLTPMSLDTTLRPVVTRRLKDTFQGKTVRGHAHLAGFNLLCATNDVYWEIRYNATVTIAGTTTVNDVDATNSISEYDTYTGATNTVSGGTLILNGFAKAGQGSSAALTTMVGSESAVILGRTYANVRDTYTLCARSITAAATISLAVQLQEQY